MSHTWSLGHSSEAHADHRFKLCSARIGLLPCSAAQLFVPLLAVIALERDISFALGRSIQSALAALINMAETNEDVSRRP